MEFWLKKFDDNVRRDDKVRKLLEEQKTKQLIIWECTVKKMAKNGDYRSELLEKIERFFLSTDLFMEV